MKIALSLIMLNESRVLPRLLNSVWPIIDYYCVVDTGSTDNSKEIVKNFFDEKGIPGEIHDFPHKPEDAGFLVFDEWRNYGLEKLRGKADMGLWIDCDEQFIMPNGYSPEQVDKLKKYLSQYDSISVQAVSSTKWRRSNFFRLNKPWKWISPIHEVLESAPPIRYGNLDEKTAYILVTSDGHSWTSEELDKKYDRHVKSFLRYIEKNGNEPRAVHYLAQSFRDQNTKESQQYAIEWYKERIKITTGFDEERYISQREIGKLYVAQGKPIQDSIYEYLKCSELDLDKADHFVAIIELLQKEGQWNLAYQFSSYAMRYHKKVPNKLLFIDDDIYNHQILNLHKINCSRVGKTAEIAPYIDVEEAYNHYASTPSDFNEHMPVLRKYAKECSSIVEINKRWSIVSTYALLASKPRFLTSYDYYKLNDQEALSIYAQKVGTKFKSIVGSPITKPVERCGLLFLDSIHDYMHVLEELNLHSPNVTKYIIIHDTVVYGIVNSDDKESPKQGIKGAIEEFLENNSEWSLIEELFNNNGLAVLERGKWKDRKIKFNN